MLTRYLCVLLSFFLLGCGSSQPSKQSKKKKAAVKKVAKKKVSLTSKQRLAKKILANPSRFKLANYHISGVKDSATALRNMRDTAAGRSARRSRYGKAPGGSCSLKNNMLRGMIALSKEYRVSISEIAGGSHSRKSRHYQGVSYDVTHINGRKVSWNNPYYRAYMRKARKLGATEVLGPGNKGHSGHLHIAWPRP